MGTTNDLSYGHAGEHSNGLEIDVSGKQQMNLVLELSNDLEVEGNIEHYLFYCEG